MFHVLKRTRAVPVLIRIVVSPSFPLAIQITKTTITQMFLHSLQQQSTNVNAILINILMNVTHRLQTVHMLVMGTGLKHDSFSDLSSPNDHLRGVYDCTHNGPSYGRFNAPVLVKVFCGQTGRIDCYSPLRQRHVLRHCGT